MGVIGGVGGSEYCGGFECDGASDVGLSGCRLARAFNFAGSIGVRTVLYLASADGSGIVGGDIAIGDFWSLAKIGGKTR